MEIMTDAHYGMQNYGQWQEVDIKLTVTQYL